MKKIEILGTGCAACRRAEKVVRDFLAKHGIEAEIVKVEDVDAIISYGVLMTPGIVIDGELKAAGRIPRERELKEWLAD